MQAPQPTTTAPASKSDQETTKTLTNLLETRTKMFFSAINTRSFNPTSQPWTFIDTENFHAGLAIQQQPLKSAKRVTDTWIKYIRLNPGYHVNVTGVSSSITPNKKSSSSSSSSSSVEGAVVVETGRGFAEVYINVKLLDTGQEGIVKDAICKVVWVWNSLVEEWRCVFTDTFVGMDFGD